jgi:hypothetical protein
VSGDATWLKAMITVNSGIVRTMDFVPGLPNHVTVSAEPGASACSSARNDTALYRDLLAKKSRKSGDPAI